jgi:putative tryptophan/tyrosine transport system substrate-binding protein
MRHPLQIALIGFALLLVVLPSHAQDRVALVIGNNIYSDVPPPTAPGPGSGPLAGNPTLQLAQDKPIVPAGGLLVEDVPLPGNVSVSNPQNIPENFKRFSGAWVGAWGGRLHHILIVENVMADGNANVVYAVGDNPAANVLRQSTRYDATIVGNTLRIERFATYELASDGKLDATYEASNGRSYATMSRIELADLTRPGETIAWTSDFPATALKENGKSNRPEKSAIPMIGYLAFESNPTVRARFRQGLKEAGFIDGRDVRIEFRSADKQAVQLPELAADFVRSQAAVIVEVDVFAIYAAKAATSTIPIVFQVDGDPVTLGLVTSLSRPGGNATGAAFISSELLGKQLDLLHQMVPRATAFGYLSQFGVRTSEETKSDIVEASRALETELVVAEARSRSDIETAFATFVQRGTLGLVVGPYALFDLNYNTVLELAARNKIPAMYSNSGWVSGGGLMSYSASSKEALKIVVDYVVRILRGAKPADLPVQQPTAFEFAINLKTAKALGLTVPPNLLAIADEVIESRYGRLGVRFWQITQETAANLNLQSTRGVIVTDVDDTGAAKPAGIQAGDVIMRMGGKEILELRDLPRIVAETPANKVVEVVIIRAGVERSINVTLGPEIPPRAQ